MPDYKSSAWGYEPAFATEPSQAILFTVPGEPMSKQRPRFSPKSGHAYTPKQTRDAESDVRNAYVTASGGKMFTSHVGLEIQFFMGTKRRKDVDNLVKTVLDALNKVAFDDDYLVHVLGAVKFYSTPKLARTVVRIYPIDGMMIETD